MCLAQNSQFLTPPTPQNYPATTPDTADSQASPVSLPARTLASDRDVSGGTTHESPRNQPCDWVRALFAS
jgi:hypothetical protein